MRHRHLFAQRPSAASVDGTLGRRGHADRHVSNTTLHVPWSAFIASLAATLALAFVLAACAGEPVTLATQKETGCFLANTTGLLIPDSAAGTAIVSEDMAKTTAQVVWPTGFTGRKSGDVIEVLNRSGQVVARTGQRYELLGGYNPASQWIACADGIYPPLWPSPKR